MFAVCKRECILETAPGGSSEATRGVLKPQDIFIALKLVARPGPWQMRPLGQSLRLSASEVSHGLKRLKASKLFNASEWRVIRPTLFEFIAFGLPYAFPAQLGSPDTGMPTAFSASPLVERLVGGDVVAIWKSKHGKVRGRTVEPLWRGAPDAAAEDAVLHEYLALVDALRVGRARERALAKDELKRRLLQ